MGDIKKTISEVMAASKLAGDLNDLGMWDLDKKDFKPASSYKITYDSQTAQLEPIYYWLLDFIQDGGWDAKKVTDNFMASPGSGQFQDITQRMGKFQDEAGKWIGGLNQVIKSALNLIYDLKEFEVRLSHYDDANSDDKDKKETGMLALKQIWLDNVDIKRGNGSIHAMAGQIGYTTIREVFMMANSLDDLKKINNENDGLINDQVMRILQPRVKEFLIWQEYSEKELRKRMNIEKNYLRSQIETIKLYSAWMKPYLKAAEELKQKGFGGSAALVNAFSTSMFELTLFGKKEEKLPDKLKNYNLKRKYYSCIVVSFQYRGHVSQRVGQKGDYVFAMGGRVDITFDSYALNEEEIKIIEKELEKEDVSDSMRFSMNMAEDALNELEKDLDHFLKSDDEKKEAKKKEEKKSQDINPFSALLGIFKKNEKSSEKKKEVESAKDIKTDNYVEKVVRVQAVANAAKGLYTIYDIYKKAHKMASAPGEGFTRIDPSKTKEPDARFGDIFRGSS